MRNTTISFERPASTPAIRKSMHRPNTQARYTVYAMAHTCRAGRFSTEALYSFCHLLVILPVQKPWNIDS